MLRKFLLLAVAAIVLCGAPLPDADGGIFRKGLFRNRCQPRCGARRRQPCAECAPCRAQCPEKASAIELCPVSRMGVWNNVWYYLCQRCDDCLSASASTNRAHPLGKCDSPCTSGGMCTDPIISAYSVAVEDAGQAEGEVAAARRPARRPHPHVFAADLGHYVKDTDPYDTSGTTVTVTKHAIVVQKTDAAGQVHKYPVQIAVVKPASGRPLHVGQQMGPDTPGATADADVVGSKSKKRHKVRVRGGSLAGQEFDVLMVDDIPN